MATADITTMSLGAKCGLAQAIVGTATLVWLEPWSMWLEPSRSGVGEEHGACDGCMIFEALMSATPVALASMGLFLALSSPSNVRSRASKNWRVCAAIAFGAGLLLAVLGLCLACITYFNDLIAAAGGPEKLCRDTARMARRGETAPCDSMHAFSRQMLPEISGNTTDQYPAGCEGDCLSVINKVLVMLADEEFENPMRSDVLWQLAWFLFVIGCMVVSGRASRLSPAAIATGVSHLEASLANGDLSAEQFADAKAQFLLDCAAPQPQELPDYRMGATDAALWGARKTFTKAGRSSRSEYWWFVGLGAALLFVVAQLPEQQHGSFRGSTAKASQQDDLMNLLESVAPQVQLALLLLAILSLGTATVRRLHDTNRSGWRLLLLLLPPVNVLVVPALLFWLLRGSEPSLNSYGSVPLNERFWSQPPERGPSAPAEEKAGAASDDMERGDVLKPETDDEELKHETKGDECENPLVPEHLRHAVD